MQPQQSDAEFYRQAIETAIAGLESLSPIEALTRLLELRNTVQSETFVQWVRSFPKKPPRLRGRHVLILETMETAPIHGVMADGVTVGTEMETAVYYSFEQVMPVGEELRPPLPKVGSFASVKTEVDTHEDFKNYRGKIKRVVKTGWVLLYAHNGSDWFTPSELHFEEPRHV